MAAASHFRLLHGVVSRCHVRNDQGVEVLADGQMTAPPMVIQKQVQYYARTEEKELTLTLKFWKKTSTFVDDIVPSSNHNNFRCSKSSSKSS